MGTLKVVTPAMLMLRLTYNNHGYPSLVYTHTDLAESKPRSPSRDQLALLLVKSIFEDGGLGRVLSVDEVTPGTPANGWTIRFTGETNGRTADPYIATYDGEAISYNDDPSRQSRDLGEGLELALEFAAKSGGKNCTKGRPCGGSCIAKGKNCRIENLSKNQKKAADSLTESGQPWSTENPWHSNRKDVFSEMTKLQGEIDEWNKKEAKLKPRYGEVGVGGGDFDAFLQGDVRLAYLSALSRGRSPAEALAESKAQGRLAVTNWNNRASKGRVTAGYSAENQRWVGSGDSIAERVHARFEKYSDPSPSQQKRSPEPAKSKIVGQADQTELQRAKKALNTPTSQARKKQSKPKSAEPKQPEAPKRKLSEAKRAELTKKLEVAESNYDAEVKKFRQLAARRGDMFNAPTVAQLKAQNDRAVRARNKRDKIQQQLA